MRLAGTKRAAWAIVTAVALFSALILSPAPAPAAQRVHQSNFDDAKAVSEEWSANHVEATPRGGRKFLGEFADDNVSLSLKSLPPHQFVRVTFDLLVLKNWIGEPTDTDPSGPHQFGLRIEGGSTLMQSSFANVAMGRESTRFQTYPSLIAGERLSAGTRAETNTLGYATGDSIYRMSFTFPHKDGAIQLYFYGQNLEDVDDQSWGLDNVSVEVLSADEIAPLDDAAQTRLWEDLGTSDPAHGFAAAWQMISLDDKAVSLAERMLAAEVSKAPKVDKLADRVKQLIAELDADKYRDRQRAMRELLELGNRTVPLLRQAVKSPQSPEVRWRLEQILAQLDDVDPATFTDDVRRRERLLAVLDVIGSPAAKKLSAQLTK